MNEEDLIYTYEELENLTIKYQDLYLKERNKVKKAIEVIDLVKPELWNISNKMTYKLLDIKNILLGVDKK